MDELKKLRKKIDQIDSEIAKYLRKRLETIEKIRKFKKNSSLDIRDPKRETEIISKLETNYEKNIFKEILKQSRNVQQEL